MLSFQDAQNKRAQQTAGAQADTISSDGRITPDRRQKTELNRLLRALLPDDYEWIQPHLQTVTLNVKDVLAEADEPFQHVYFIESGVASVVNEIAGGTVEVGTVGNEGMAGLSVFLDAGPASSKTFIQIPGVAKRMPAQIFAEGAEHRPDLRRILNRYTQAFITQVSQTAACNRSHQLEERCARWLLMTHDRVDGTDTFPLTHQFLAYMLGVRRSGVTIAASTLQRAGLIRYSRGRITITNREGLEHASCECYGIVRAHFDRLLG